MASPHISILVLGAGELGTAVLKALAAHPQHSSITISLRAALIHSSNPAKAASFHELDILGISIIAGDIASMAEQKLANTFSSFDTLIGCTGMSHDAGTQLKIAHAVLVAKVRRYPPWQFGVDYDGIGRGSSQDLFTEQLDVRELLRHQKVTEWVIVSTGLFVSVLFEPSFGAVSEDRETVRALGNWEHKVTVTTPEDIGKVVADIVWAAPEVQGVVYTEGETVSYGRLAEILEMVWNRGLGKGERSVEMLNEEFTRNPGDGLNKCRVVFAQGKGVIWSEEVIFKRARGGLKLQGVED
ncbi:MAG: hypothetical protein Q9161_006029 [Pseudevernia consocians]